MAVPATSSMLSDERMRPGRPRADRAVVRLAAVGGERTLDDVIVGAWEALTAHRTARCPVCGDELTPQYGRGGSEPIGGSCRGCGTEMR